jgi:hypothetical protein
MRYATALFLLLLTTAPSSYSQSTKLNGVVPIVKRQALTVSFGTGIPQSRSGVTSFWDKGPSGSITFLVNVSRPVSLGMGIDAVVLEFNEGAFRSTYPAVPLQSKDMVMANVYLAMKCVMMPSMAFAPYCGLTVGATHISEAVYGNVIDSVRVSYYNIPGRTKLTLGVTLGADIYLNSWLAFDMEAKTNYVHNDPDLGLTSFVRGGFRFIL